MGKQAERLGKAPGRERVGRETRMDESQTRCEIVVGEVGVVLTYLHGREHTLVYNVSARKRADIKVFVVDAVLYLLAYYI